MVILHEIEMGMCAFRVHQRLVMRVNLPFQVVAAKVPAVGYESGGRKMSCSTTG